jgi:hypothetical protein
MGETLHEGTAAAEVHQDLPKKATLYSTRTVEPLAGKQQADDEVVAEV